jgi:glucokinase
MVGNKIVAVDFGGTSIRAALMMGRRTLRFIDNNTLAKQGKKAVLEQLEKTIRDAINGEKIKGIGIGSPGPLIDGVVKNPPNLPLRNFNLKGFLEKKFKTKVRVENDANCAALAELHYGVKKKNFIVLTLGTGIGCGLIINGQLYNGSGYASEGGHIVIQDGKDLEYWASGSRIKKDAKKAFGKELIASELKKKNNAKADRILKNAAMNLGKGIASLANVLDPEVFVLVGGLRDSGREYFKIVNSEANKYCMLPKKLDIRWSQLEKSGVLGAASLILKK